MSKPRPSSKFWVLIAKLESPLGVQASTTINAKNTVLQYYQFTISHDSIFNHGGPWINSQRSIKLLLLGMIAKFIGISNPGAVSRIKKFTVLIQYYIERS